MKVVKKKYETGGKLSNSDKTYVARIEALKKQILAEKDASKKAKLMEELKRLRGLAKNERADIQSDSMKESRAIKAEKAGDKGRAIRIRSRKQTQGVGEVGK